MSVKDVLERGGSRKLLALDGGGSRGVLSLEILAALERRLRERSGRDDYVLATPCTPWGGTSTGDHRGRPGARPAVAEVVPSTSKLRFLPLQLRSRYRDRDLSTERVRYFGARRTLGDPELRTLLLVVLHNSVTDSVWPLSNNTRAKYNRAERYLNEPPDRNLDLPLTKLVRGSTAAPVYVPPEEIHRRGDARLRARVQQPAAADVRDGHAARVRPWRAGRRARWRSSAPARAPPPPCTRGCWRGTWTSPSRPRTAAARPPRRISTATSRASSEFSRCVERAAPRPGGRAGASR